jgi:hypothetical protein
MGTTIIILFVVLIIIDAYYGYDLPKKYRFRKCMGRQWKATYPGVNKNEFRKFLNLFTNAFEFSNKNGLKFGPEDVILDIYKELYPSKWMADSFELETLADDLEGQYHVDLDKLWHDKLTLGELFSRMKRI